MKLRTPRIPNKRQQEAIRGDVIMTAVRIICTYVHVCSKCQTLNAPSMVIRLIYGTDEWTRQLLCTFINPLTTQCRRRLVLK